MTIGSGLIVNPLTVEQIARASVQAARYALDTSAKEGDIARLAAALVPYVHHKDCK